MSTFGIICRAVIIILIMYLVGVLWCAGNPQSDKERAEQGEVLKGSAVVFGIIALIQLIMLIGVNS